MLKEYKFELYLCFVNIIFMGILEVEPDVGR